jgi:hypothetical protein
VLVEREQAAELVVGLGDLADLAERPRRLLTVAGNEVDLATELAEDGLVERDLCKRCATSPVSISAASAPGGSRTPNLLIRSQMLYPLSYRRR